MLALPKLTAFLTIFLMAFLNAQGQHFDVKGNSYRIALEAGFHKKTVSLWLNGVKVLHKEKAELPKWGNQVGSVMPYGFYLTENYSLIKILPHTEG